MSNYALTAQKRTATGRKVKALRRDGIIPANIFGKKITSQSIQVAAKPLVETLKKAGETALINLTVEGDKAAHPVLISGYSQNPVTNALLHVDFHEVDLTVKTTAMVPLKAIGEAPAIAAGNILVMLKNEVEVEALPADLPDIIEVDVTSLAEVGAHILAKDLKFDRTKVKLDLEDEEQIVVIQEPAKEPEPVVVAEEAPAEGEAAPAEGEGTKPAEGEAAKPEDKKEEPKAEK
ncbi:MAG: 50S ribosomal protein L25/general stress protein Ctc, large subunit ribosomal protein L25 [Microgenomates group bacterium GW2011_GWC1_46_16]|uniref:Large ribosomal subunit protein bL25 n=2 Tax=Candidatus Collieribacteriota TaxID=1752725 RepID=A0A1F5FXD2_9BACT|nr:MAG: 50S ribosomal protein L25 [Microgenomates group bacterium GW2011_GWF1_46_12]KKU27021.1 MAG: 50S ribosomal protein L25/general stress protein Ctc, large subunit ribosomal protein L25 [Microgenomates group bacterium GW2011_GWC1_46_16]KKU27937.1 MAG: 50S ribosomal protein L25 [Microgenomates group bacterium GW2011_GWF2_46_18]KKU44340.1 MAG: 50S ribosomal protein L25 [Microgenomates group bacterium GW2011_GWA1_46_7]KKU45307.1 MAG: 50S ribosomal protein L25 [Microgenomates group bacterium GW